MGKSFKKFIRINNDLFGVHNRPYTSKFHAIGTLGFTILTYLVWKSGGGYVVDTTPAQIMQVCNISRVDIIGKQLQLLLNNGLLDCKQSLSPLRKNQTLIIDLEKYYSSAEGYELIPEELFIRNIGVITHKGWAVLCCLTKYFNMNFGTEASSGYASITEEDIANILHLHRNTVAKYIQALKDSQLIRVLPQEIVFVGFNEAGIKEYNFTPNRYVITHKLKDKAYHKKDKT